MLSKEYVQTVLSDGGYLDIFIKAAHRAQQSWLEVINGSPQNMEGAIPRERSVYLNRRIIELICKTIEDDSNVDVNTIHGATLITINNEITIRFKKLNQSLRAMNTKTRRVHRLWYQNSKPLPGDFSKWINITFGWQHGSTGMINALHIVYEYGDKIHWSFSVDAAGTVVDAPTQLVMAEDVEPKPYETKIRDTKRAERVAKDNSDNTEEAN